MPGAEEQRGSVPHGGTLIDRYALGQAADRLREEAENLYVVELTSRDLSDLEMLAGGAYSPLTGFMSGFDYRAVVESMRLENGLPWTIPITLSLSQKAAETVRAKEQVALSYAGNCLGILYVQDVFSRDAKKEASHVFGTTDVNHPGVASLYEEGDMLVGGPVSLFRPIPDVEFPSYRLPPAETRRIFAQRGWQTVVGFQTRNPVHRAHEYLQKCALEIVDGLLLHPIVGETKADDVPAEIRMRSYEALLANYYPKERVLLAVNPASMRYAGPREAIFHAIVRKNFGCTHFIVGRDHAGVGDYYGPYDAQHIFTNFRADELGIQPLFFENSFFCEACGNMATEKTCPHGPESHLMLSGTQVRAMLRAGELPPAEFSRPEVASILANAMKEAV